MLMSRCKRLRALLQYRALPAILLASAALLVANGQGWPPRGIAMDGLEAGPAGAHLKRIREGVRLRDQLGTFKVRGDRAAFTTTKGRHFGCLENLALERVMLTITNGPDGMRWSVDGVVTEYRGANYLLLTRATLKVNPPDDAPAAAAAPRRQAR